MREGGKLQDHLALIELLFSKKKRGKRQFNLKLYFCQKKDETQYFEKDEREKILQREEEAETVM